ADRRRRVARLRRREEAGRNRALILARSEGGTPALAPRRQCRDRHVSACRARLGEGKKLLEAAEHWARSVRRPRRDEEADDEERRHAGVSQSEWDAASAWADDESGRGAGPFIVWPANWAMLQVFLACQTQWEHHPMIQTESGFIGG